MRIFVLTPACGDYWLWGDVLDQQIPGQPSHYQWTDTWINFWHLDINALLQQHDKRELLLGGEAWYVCVCVRACMLACVCFVHFLVSGVSECECSVRMRLSARVCLCSCARARARVCLCALCSCACLLPGYTPLYKWFFLLSYDWIKIICLFVFFFFLTWCCTACGRSMSTGWILNPVFGRALAAQQRGYGAVTHVCVFVNWARACSRFMPRVCVCVRVRVRVCVCVSVRMCAGSRKKNGVFNYVCTFTIDNIANNSCSGTSRRRSHASDGVQVSTSAQGCGRGSRLARPLHTATKCNGAICLRFAFDPFVLFFFLFFIFTNRR